MTGLTSVFFFIKGELLHVGAAELLAGVGIFLISTALWPVFHYLFLKKKFPGPEPELPPRTPYLIPIEWLTKQTTISETEQRNSFAQDDSCNTIPFGYENEIWSEIKSAMDPGDEVWEFCSPPQSWEKLCGRAGVCIVRQRQIIDGIVTMMN